MSSREQVIGSYPFTKEESPTRVHAELGHHLGHLLDFPIFDYLNRGKIFDYVLAHFQIAEAQFEQEETGRKSGKPNANLFYHGKEHAIYQATYDAITTSQAILTYSKVSQYLTPEGVLAIIIASTYHDIGYVYETSEDTNYVLRQPVHVEESIRAAKIFLEKVPIPHDLGPTKLKSLVPVGIHATNFPFSTTNVEERRAMLEKLDPKEKKEALIVALSVQLADLGGQVARTDYLRNLVDLRQELNCISDGLGYDVLGQDDEMSEKCKAFIENVVKKGVGKTANAFFGTNNHTFSRQWQKHLGSR